MWTWAMLLAHQERWHTTVGAPLVPPLFVPRIWAPFGGRFPESRPRNEKATADHREILTRAGAHAQSAKCDAGLVVPVDRVVIEPRKPGVA